MTDASRLLRLLDDEAELIRSRDFDALAVLATEKAQIAATLGKNLPTEKLTEIKQRADRNARLLEIVLRATRSLRNRFQMLAQVSKSVGYSRDGTRMSCEDEKSVRRV